MINLSKKEISKKIEDFEYYNNAMKYTGGGIIINSLEIDEEDEMIRADITLDFYMDNRSERYGDCEYSFESLGIKSK